jgi:hypothetical protein
MFRNRRPEDGMTLLEVLLSLVMTGIIIGMVLTLYMNHYRLIKELMIESEMDYSLFRGGQVLAATVSAGQEVEWKDEILCVTRIQDEKPVVDLFYLADKDNNGVQDLYREHLSVPNPIASGLTDLKCVEIDKGLWEIRLEARLGDIKINWKRSVRQRL